MPRSAREQLVGCVVQAGATVRVEWMGEPLLLAVQSVQLADDLEHGEAGEQRYTGRATVTRSTLFTAIDGSEPVEVSVTVAHGAEDIPPAGLEEAWTALLRFLRGSLAVAVSMKGAQGAGLLFVGAPGAGKSHLLRALQAQAAGSLASLDLRAMLGEHPPGAQFEAAVGRKFRSGPRLVLLDQLEALSAQEGSEALEAAQRCLLQGIEALPGNTVVLAATREGVPLPGPLARCKRFSRQYEMGALSRPGRGAVLKAFAEGSPGSWPDAVDEVVARTPGWLPGDLYRLTRAALTLETSGNSGKSRVRGGGSRLEAASLIGALRRVKPRSMGEIPHAAPCCGWDRLAGYEEARGRAYRLGSAFFDPEGSVALTRLGVTSLPAGLFIYGPSGCGKTMLAHGLVARLGCNLVVLKVSELLCRYLGETEAHIRRVFKHALSMAPCVVFFDEIDSLGLGRGEDDASDGGVGKRALGALLNELDGVSDRKGVFAIAATSRPDLVDAALIRPGRFEQHLYLGVPTHQDTLAILERQRGQMPIEAGVDLEAVARRLAGASCATVEAVCREAALWAVRQDPEGATSVTDEAFQNALASGVAFARPDEMGLLRLEEFRLNRI